MSSGARMDPCKARDVKVGQWVRPAYFVGDVGRGWKVVSVEVRGQDVLIDVQTENGGVQSLPPLGVDEMVRVKS